MGFCARLPCESVRARRRARRRACRPACRQGNAVRRVPLPLLCQGRRFGGERLSLVCQRCVRFVWGGSVCALPPSLPQPLHACVLGPFAGWPFLLPDCLPLAVYAFCCWAFPWASRATAAATAAAAAAACSPGSCGAPRAASCADASARSAAHRSSSASLQLPSRGSRLFCRR